MFKYIVATCGPEPDEVRIRAYCEEGASHFDWLVDHGVPFVAEFYPDAQVTQDYLAVLARDDIELVDVTPHPEERVPILEAAIRAGKHVLSQKPFVIDLDTGQRLVEMADEHEVLLAPCCMLVQSVLPLGNGLVQVQLQQVEPDAPMFQG